MYEEIIRYNLKGETIIMWWNKKKRKLNFVAEVVYVVKCPRCGHTMSQLAQPDLARDIFCSNNQCELFDIRYRKPKVRVGLGPLTPSISTTYK
jgi:hypothetical protein